MKKLVKVCAEFYCAMDDTADRIAYFSIDSDSCDVKSKQAEIEQEASRTYTNFEAEIMESCGCQWLYSEYCDGRMEVSDAFVIFEKTFDPCSGANKLNVSYVLEMIVPPKDKERIIAELNKAWVSWKAKFENELSLARKNDTHYLAKWFDPNFEPDNLDRIPSNYLLGWLDGLGLSYHLVYQQ